MPRLLFTTAAVIVALIAAWLIKVQQCDMQWTDSGAKPEFFLFAGCMLTLPDGRRIPASAYRELDR